MNRISVQRVEVVARQLAEVRPSSSRLLVRAELVVDGEVREVEEAVAHARVLPVDDPEPRAVVR